MRHWLVAIAAVAGAACADLGAVPTDVCGNGVIEVGEDCEVDGVDAEGNPTLCGTSGGPNQCAYECSTEVDCPIGFACGTDLRCRQAGGAFTAGPSLGVVADDVLIADVDGDQIADLVSAGGSALEVRFGSAQADLASVLSTPVSTPPAALAVGALDADGTDDLVVATTPGILTFLGGSDGTIDPFSYPVGSFAPGSNTGFGVAVKVDTRPGQLDDQVLLAWADQIGVPLAAVVFPDAVTELPRPGAGMGPTNPTILNMPAQALSVGALATNRDAGGADDGAREIAIGYTTGRQVFIYRVSGPSAASPAAPIVTEPTGQVIDLGVGRGLRGASGIFFGYFDADGCLDLLAHVDAVAGQRLVLARGIAVGQVCTGVLAAPVDILTLGPTDPLRVLAVADLDGDGTTDVVASTGIYRVDPAGPTPDEVLAFADDINDAAVVDINGDGRVDVATFREGRPDVEVLISTGVTFNRFVVSTSAAVQRLAAGDFDGDLVDDLAIVEIDSSGDDAVFTVSVSFGALLGAPSTAVVMDRLPQIGGLVGARTLAAGGADGVDDLVILRKDPGVDAVEATVLYGSGARAMVSPLTLVEDDLAPQQPVSAVLGQLDDQAGVDLFTVGNRGGAYLYSGDGAGGFTVAATAAWPAVLDYGDALWATGDVDGDGVDEIAAAERHSERVGFGAVRAVLMGADLAALDPQLVADFGAGDQLRGARRLAFADLDGDGDLDLLLAVVGRASERNHRLQIGWNAGGVISPLRDAVAAPGCLDAARLQLDGDSAPELAVLCVEGDQLVVRRYDATEPETLSPSGELARIGGTAGALEVGDLDGDGLLDLLLLTRASANVTVRIFLQRDAHDL